MKMTALRGPNFSGRTRRLREWVGLPQDSNEEPVCNGNAYIGLDPTANLSGLAPTVLAEFELLATDPSSCKHSTEALEKLGFIYCLDRSPFVLSGGEQIVVSVLAALAARPRRLAIDCALEQLSPRVRRALLEHLDSEDVDLMIADNRLDEWFTDEAESFNAPADAPRFQTGFVGAAELTGVTVELVDITFAYIKRQPVFEGLNFTLSPGQLHLLKGTNGSGKSTLSKILAGLLKPTSGEIRIDGKPAQPWKKPGSLTRYHYQDPDLQLFATRVAAQLPLQSEHITEAFGLSAFVDEHPLDLPYVLRKRLAIGCAMAGSAPLIALDEPTLGQDNASALALHDICGQRSGLVISHSNIFHDIPEICLGAKA